MAIKVYEYKTCSTCQKALKFLDEKKVIYKKLSIVETPPTILELKKMLGYLKTEGETFKKLFNTSGVLYREMKIPEKLKNGMTEKEALELLVDHGKLIKRPFLLAEKNGTVGFHKETWSELLQV